MRYSQGKFGFSVQKQIWLDWGGKLGEYDILVNLSLQLIGCFGI